MKKLLVATALLAAGTSTVLAQGVFRYGPSGATADRLGGYVDPSYVQGNRAYYDYAPGPLNYSGTVSGQPSPDSEISRSAKIPEASIATMAQGRKRNPAETPGFFLP